MASFNEQAVKDGYLPESLTYTIVEDDVILPMACHELELEPAVNQLYQQIYQEVTGG